MPSLGSDRNRSVARGLLRCAVLALAAGALMAWAIVPPAPEQDSDLAVLEASIATTYPHVRHLPPHEMAPRLAADPAGFVILDVREADEFSVSRIPGARRVDPLVSKAAFLTEFGTEISDKTVVFYCSVGVRSSRLAGRLADHLQALGARGVYNLSGGIFRWHNEKRALFGNSGPTSFLHPYDDRWGRYVSRSHLVSHSPRRGP